MLNYEKAASPAKTCLSTRHTLQGCQKPAQQGSSFRPRIVTKHQRGHHATQLLLEASLVCVEDLATFADFDA